MARPSRRLVPPATTPLTRVMVAGATWSRSAVTQLSTLQAMQAPTMSSAPEPELWFAGPADGEPGEDDERGAGGDAASDVLAEHDGGEGGGGDQLEVEQQRGGGRWGACQPRDKEERADEAAGDDGGCETATAVAQGVRVEPAAGEPRSDGESGAEVEQAGEDGGGGVVGEAGGQRGGGAEEGGGKGTAGDARSDGATGRWSDHGRWWGGSSSVWSAWKRASSRRR
jgi:hypothetical protein